MTNVQTQNPKKLPNNRKAPTKIDKVVKFVDNKNRNNKGNNRSHKRKIDPSNNKENMASKTGSVTQIQVSDSETNTDIEDNGYIR